MSRVETTLKPESGGTQFIFQYMAEVPYVYSEQEGDLVLGMVQLPKILEEFMLDIKKDVEGVS